MASELRGRRILILSVTLLLGPTWGNSDNTKDGLRNSIPYVYLELCHPQPANTRVGLLLNWALRIGCATFRHLAADAAARIAKDIIFDPIANKGKN
jgi:hypothetical protein